MCGICILCATGRQVPVRCQVRPLATVFEDSCRGVRASLPGRGGPVPAEKVWACWAQRCVGALDVSARSCLRAGQHPLSCGGDDAVQSWCPPRPVAVRSSSHPRLGRSARYGTPPAAMRSPATAVHGPPSHPRARLACLACRACRACRAYRAPALCRRCTRCGTLITSTETAL